MNALKSSLSSSYRNSNIALVVVVVAAYFSAFAMPHQPYSPAQVVALIVLGVIYMLVGTYGSDYCENSQNAWVRWAYFAIEIPIGAAVLFISQFTAWLILLPMGGSAVVLLPRWGAWLINAVILGVITIGMFWVSQDWGIVFSNSFAFLAALVFVAVFTQLIVNEQKARTEVEQLAQQLAEANRKLSEYAVKVEELATAQERNRLAREIHDGLGHYLTAINMQIKAAQAVLDQDAKRSLDAMSKAQTLTQEALADVRRSVAALRAGPIANRPLSESLTDLLGEVCSNGIQADLTIQGTARPLPPQVELALYRATQEGLTNVCKHARATYATLTLDYAAEDRVRLAVQDNGVGAVEADGGFGLLGLRERVQLLNGQVRIQTAPDQGFMLEIEIPTASAQAQPKG